MKTIHTRKKVLYFKSEKAYPSPCSPTRGTRRGYFHARIPRLRGSFELPLGAAMLTSLSLVGFKRPRFFVPVYQQGKRGHNEGNVSLMEHTIPFATMAKINDRANHALDAIEHEIRICKIFMCITDNDNKMCRRMNDAFMSKLNTLLARIADILEMPTPTEEDLDNWAQQLQSFSDEESQNQFFSYDKETT